ncbi:DUF2953 domain-containing protein [Virgibacillus kimchii]
MFWFIVGVFAVTLLIVILLARIYVSVSLLYTDEAKHISLSVSLFRIRVFNKTYPLMPEKLNFPASAAEYENFSLKLRHLFNTARVSRQVVSLILQKLMLHKLVWKTEGGTGDAASTGRAAGGIWSLKGLITGLIGNVANLESKPVIQVIPHYQKMFLQTHLDCMVSIQIAQAIHIMFKIIRLLFTMKPEKAVSA